MLWSLVMVISFGAIAGVFGVQDVISAAVTNLKELSPNDVYPHPHTTNWTVDFIFKHGYPVETHPVTTEDGYIVTLHRIPSSPKGGASNKVKTPVLLHHGFLGCSADWVVLGPKYALGFLLADKGYDVWMANARGTTDSKQHAKLNPTDRKYWDFSWHEVGSLDLPAEIDYILNVTKNYQLTYIGYSMGTTAFWVLGGTRPEYFAKINEMIALAPVAFFEHVRGVFKAIASLATNVDWVISMMGTGEFLPTNKFMTWAAKTFCKDDAWSQSLCKNVMFLLCGFDSTNLNVSLVATIFEYAPAGASTKEILHFAQSVRAAPTFRRYDYGWIRNLFNYGSVSPPAYRLAGVACPVHLFVGPNDWIANEKDVQTLANLLPDVNTFKVVNRSNFNHLDFVFSNDAHELIYTDVLRILNVDYTASVEKKVDRNL